MLASLQNNRASLQETICWLKGVVNMVFAFSNADLSQSALLRSDSPDKIRRTAGVRLKLFVGEAAIGIIQINLLDCIG